MVYNFQNFQVLENDDKYRITTDVIGLICRCHWVLQAFGRLQDQRRECDIIKRLNFSIVDQSENTINVSLWGDCAEETFGKKHEDMEPPITVLERFARLNRNTDYGHLSNAFNATLVTLNSNIPKENLMKERKRIPLCEIAKLDQESSCLHGNIRTISQENVIEDGDITVSQLTTPPEAYTKRKTLGNDTPIVYEDLGLAEICTQKMSSTKPLKNIKKEK
ncbi:hypothetical protein K1719_017716 [Acacia pycnantha]|nr:hypothetical protein K1719_017716 [Acacia pycnantha]